MRLHTATVCAVSIALFATITAAQLHYSPQVRAAAEAEPASPAGTWTNPTSHIYREGDHLTAAYGDVSDVTDWNRRSLPTPPAEHRWVQYGETYMLIDGTTGLIKTIMQASWEPNRA